MAKVKEDYPRHHITLARYAKAISHPSRLLILKFLEISKTCSFGTLSSILPISKASTAQHLTVLKDSGLVFCDYQPPHMFYRLNQKAWKQAQAMFEKFFNPMEPEEFVLFANFFGNFTPELQEIAMGAVHNSREMVITVMENLQKKGFLDQDIKLSKLSDEELRSLALRVGFNK